jgi:hypothetical protein
MDELPFILPDVAMYLACSRCEFELLFVLAIFVRHFHFPFTIFKTNFTLVILG